MKKPQDLTGRNERYVKKLIAKLAARLAKLEAQQKRLRDKVNAK